MTTDDRDLVAVAVCGDSTEASLLKGFLEAEGLYCYVQGEEHRQMLGVLGAYVEPRIMVRGEDVEQAAELVELFRGSLTDEELAAQAGLDEELEFDDQAVEEQGPYRSPARLKETPRERKPMVSLGVGLVFGFGLGHCAAGARARWLALAVLEIGAIAAAVTGAVALEMVAGVVALLHVCDSVGGALAAHDQNRALAEKN